MPPDPASSPPSLLELRHLSAIGWSLAGRSAMIVGTFLMNVLTARLLDKSTFGQFLLCLAVVSVAGLLCPLGVNTTAVRNLTAVLQSGRREQALSTVATIFAVALLGGTFLAAIMIGPGAGFMYRIISAGQPAALLLLATALWTAGFGLQLTLAEVLRAAGRIRAASFAAGAVSNLGLVAMLGSMWAMASLASLDRILMYQVAIVLGSLLIFMPGLIATYSGYPVRVNIRRLPGLVWESLPGGILYPLFNLMVQVDVLTLGLFRPEDVAVYGAANRLVLLLTVPGVVLEAALAQVYAARILSGANADLHRLAQEAACVALVATVPILAIYILGGGWLTAALFGRGYAESGSLLAILSCGYVAATVSGPALLLLVLSGRQRLALSVFCACLVPFFIAVALAARFGSRELVAVTVMVGIWGIYLAFVLTARHSLGVWTIATPAAALRLLLRGVQAWRGFRSRRDRSDARDEENSMGGS